MIDPIAAVSSTSTAAGPDLLARTVAPSEGDQFAAVLERVDGNADAPTSTCACGKGCASGWVVMDDASYFGAEAGAPAVLTVSDTADRLLGSRLEGVGGSITQSLLRSFAANTGTGVLDALLDVAG